MLLKFKLDKDGFRFTNPADLIAARSIDYIKCHFDIEDSTWANTDAIVAVFKSATYNKHAETLLDSNNSCFIDPSVYKNGGTIQVKLIGDKYQNEEVISSTTVTSILEFTINENVILPVTTPSMYAIVIAELEKSKAAVDQVLTDIAYKLAHGELTGTGIQDVVYNLDGTVTITLTDNTVFTSAFSLKGDKGDPGVYYGTEEPTDPDATVWVNPDGASSSVLRIKDRLTGDFVPIAAIKGDKGDNAGFGTVEASVDNNTGTPSVDVTVSGPDTAKNISFDFHNLRYDDSELRSDMADVESDFDNLNAQFQTAVSAVTTDTEVTNIRVGDDNVTYTTAGEAVRKQFSDVKSELTYLGTDFTLPVFYKESISGTRYAEVQCNIPAGTYVIDIANITSADTDATKSRVIMYSGDTSVFDKNFDRGKHIQFAHTFTSAVTKMYLYASTSGSASSSDDFTFSGFALVDTSLKDELSDISVDATTEMRKRVDVVNLFNGIVHYGALDQDAGVPYGQLSADSTNDYWFTDLISINGATHINVVAGFNATVGSYIIFYDESKKSIGVSSVVFAVNPFTSTIPQGAKYFAVMSRPAYTESMLIMTDVPDRYYAIEETKSHDINRVPFTYKRLDRGYFNGSYFNTTQDGYIFPMQTSSAIKGSYLIPVDGLSYISYINNTSKIASSYFVTANGTVLGTDNQIPNNSKGSIAVPDGAYAYFYLIGSDADLDNNFSIVAGNQTLGRPYTFDEKDIDGMSGLSSRLLNKKVLFIGDSITAGVNYNGGWCTLVGQRTGAIVTNEGHDGYTVGKLSGRTDNLIDVLDGLSGTYDLIVLSGGYNDLTTSPRADIGSVTPYTYSSLDPYTFAGGLETYLKTAREKFPSAKLCYILTMRKMWSNQNMTNDQPVWWEIIRQCCEKWSVPYLDLSHESGIIGKQLSEPDTITTMYYHNADGTHPNQAGYEYLTPIIANFLERFF